VKASCEFSRANRRSKSKSLVILLEVYRRRSRKSDKIVWWPRKQLYFRGFVAQFNGTMTRRFYKRFVLVAAIFLSAEISARADGVLAKSWILENEVAYLRVGEVGKNLSEEIQSAQSTLAATNKIAGTVLDLRFADGDDLDSEKAVENLFVSEKLPLAILINSETRGAAIGLAKDLRDAKAGLIFGEAAKNLQPDISISVNAGDEKKFLENPFGMISTNGTHLASATTTNDFLSFVDHTSEADLVRAKIKDGDEDDNLPSERLAEPQKPFIRDPVLARAVDLIKGLAIVRQSRDEKL
jgi:hypothetical protein